jgi:hypothetical protein
MFSFILRLRRPGAVALLGAAFVLGAIGCGDDDAKTKSKSSVSAVAAGPVLQEEPDADQLNCSHLANHENYGVAYDTAVTLAERARVTEGSTHQVATRISGAMDDLCEKRGDPAYRPAADAVEAVKRGGYKYQSPALP